MLAAPATAAPLSEIATAYTETTRINLVRVSNILSTMLLRERYKKRNETNGEEGQVTRDDCEQMRTGMDTKKQQISGHLTTRNGLHGGLITRGEGEKFPLICTWVCLGMGNVNC